MILLDNIYRLLVLLLCDLWNWVLLDFIKEKKKIIKDRSLLKSIIVIIGKYFF